VPDQAVVPVRRSHARERGEKRGRLKTLLIEDSVDVLEHGPGPVSMERPVDDLNQALLIRRERIEKHRHDA
jgi:hypothetical protein